MYSRAHSIYGPINEWFSAHSTTALMCAQCGSSHSLLIHSLIGSSPKNTDENCQWNRNAPSTPTNTDLHTCGHILFIYCRKSIVRQKQTRAKIYGSNYLFVVIIMVTLLFSFDRPHIGRRKKLKTKRSRQKQINRNMYLQKQMSLTHIRGRENGTRVEENVNL